MRPGLRSHLTYAMATVAVTFLAGAALAQAAPFAYVANRDSNTLSQFDVGAGGLLAPLSPPTVSEEGGSFPQQVAVSPDGESAYVTGNEGVAQYDIRLGGRLSPKSPATVAAPIGSGYPAVSPDGRSVYVAVGRVFQYDVGAGGKLSPKSPASVAAGPDGGFGIAVSPDSKSVYVANIGDDGTISQYDVGAGGKLSPKSPATVAAGVNPIAVAVSPDGKSVYVANYRDDGTVSQFDVGAGGALSPKNPATVAAGINPRALAVSPNGGSVYVVNNYGSGSVTQFDVGPGGKLSPKTPASVPAGHSSLWLAVTPDGQSVYVTNLEEGLGGPGTVSQYDVGPGGGLSPKSPATVTVGAFPTGVAVSPLPPPTPVWEAGHTDPASGCSAKVQSPYLDANQQVTAYTKVSCPKATKLTIRSRLRSDHRFDRPLFRNITVAQKGCLAASCVVNQPAGTRFYKLTCPKSASRTLNQEYFTDIIIYAGTSPSAASPFPQRSRPSTLSPYCAS